MVEGEQDRLGAGDRPVERQDEIGEQVAVAIQTGDDQRLARSAGEQAGVGGVDQQRLVIDVGVTLGRRVHLLLQHPLVGGADRPLRSAVDAAVDLRAVLNAYSATARQLERWITSVRCAISSLVLSPAALLGAVGVLDGHPHDRDRMVDPGDRAHPGIRRPVRTITLPSIASRIRRFGLPTSRRPPV